MKVKPFVTIPNLSIVVLSLVGIISCYKATRDIYTITHDAENKNYQGGQGANGQLQMSIFSPKQTRELDSLSCTDSPLRVFTKKFGRAPKTCQEIADSPGSYCRKNTIRSHCPNACSACGRFGSADSRGTFIIEGTKRTCRWNHLLFATPSTLTRISNWCRRDGIRETCRETCSSFCTNDVTSSPSVEPTSSPTSIPSDIPSHAPTVTISCAESVINSRFGDLIDDSPQADALEWLIGDIGEDDCDNHDRIVQRFVLAAFYFSTGGDGWSSKYGWLVNEDECSWRGLTCNDNKALTGISLVENNLSGTILDEINALESLKELDLDRNALTGTIPDMSGLVKMQEFSTNDNRLTGQITDQFEALTKLTFFDVRSNGLAGSIPDFSSNTKLTDLLLSNNNLDGGLDPRLFELPKLEGLYLSSNELTGPIPENFGGSTTLEIVFLNDNLLTGSIPGITGNSLQNIQGIWLNNNKMSDPVPDTLCALKTRRGREFRELEADCDPPGNAQNECASDCCTTCYVGKGAP